MDADRVRPDIRFSQGDLPVTPLVVTISEIATMVPMLAVGKKIPCSSTGIFDVLRINSILCAPYQSLLVFFVLCDH